MMLKILLAFLLGMIMMDVIHSFKCGLIQNALRRWKNKWVGK